MDFMFCIFAFEKKDGGDFKIVFKLLTLKKVEIQTLHSTFPMDNGQVKKGGVDK